MSHNHTRDYAAWPVIYEKGYIMNITGKETLQSMCGLILYSAKMTNSKFELVFDTCSDGMAKDIVKGYFGFAGKHFAIDKNFDDTTTSVELRDWLKDLCSGNYLLEYSYKELADEIDERIEIASLASMALRLLVKWNDCELFVQ